MKEHYLENMISIFLRIFKDFIPKQKLKNSGGKYLKKLEMKKNFGRFDLEMYQNFLGLYSISICGSIKRMPKSELGITDLMFSTIYRNSLGMLTIEEREFRAKLLHFLKSINENLEELNANLKRNNKENPEV